MTTQTALAISFSGSGGVSLVADRSGPASGRPVLLLHGGGQTRNAWGRVPGTLGTAGFHVTAIDQRGHGDSDRAPDGHYAFGAFSADLQCVARAICVETGREPVVVGASLGGFAALLAATDDRPPPIAAIALVDITPWMRTDGVARIMGFMRARLEDGFASMEDAAAAVSAYLPHRKRVPRAEGLAKNLVEGADGRFRWHWDPAFVEGAGSISTDYHLYQDRIIARAGRIGMPIHLIRGQESDLISNEDVERFRALVPHATFDDIGGAGHMVAGDRNDVFLDAILGFLESFA